MDRGRQPATQPHGSGVHPDDRRATRADDPALHEEFGPGMRALRRSWALSRWAMLIFALGFGTAAVVAIAMAALAALVNASV
jgi:hypothetical protein